METIPDLVHGLMAFFGLAYIIINLIVKVKARTTSKRDKWEEIIRTGDEGTEQVPIHISQEELNKPLQKELPYTDESSLQKISLGSKNSSTTNIDRITPLNPSNRLGRISVRYSNLKKAIVINALLDRNIFD